MNKFIFVLLLSFLIQKTHSQIVFCPPGAEWHNSFYYGLEGITNNVKIKYLKDSIIGGETVKVLLHDSYYNPYCNYTPNVYTLIKQKGDTVFMRGLTTQHAWQILYNFAALPGQSWTNTINSTYASQSFNYTITVDSTNYVTINNFALKNLFVKYKYSGNSFIDIVQITERLGCNRYMFNYRSPNNCGEWINFQNFLCYQDDTFGLKQFTSKPCNYVDYVGIAKNYQSRNIKIYPNPANDFFSISTESVPLNGESILNIKDLCGREVKQVTIDNFNLETGRVDISDLAKGIYILNLSNNNELLYTGKLVKSE